MSPTIICCRCNKPVERVVWWDDPFSGTRTVVAECHGEKDRMAFDPCRIPMDQLRLLERSTGFAFKQRVSLQ